MKPLHSRVPSLLSTPSPWPCYCPSTATASPSRSPLIPSPCPFCPCNYSLLSASLPHHGQQAWSAATTTNTARHAVRPRDPAAVKSYTARFDPCCPCQLPLWHIALVYPTITRIGWPACLAVVHVLAARSPSCAPPAGFNPAALTRLPSGRFLCNPVRVDRAQQSPDARPGQRPG